MPPKYFGPGGVAPAEAGDFIIARRRCVPDTMPATFLQQRADPTLAAAKMLARRHALSLPIARVIADALGMRVAEAGR